MESESTYETFPKEFLLPTEFNNVTGNVPVAFIGNYQNITTFYNNNSQDNTVLGEPAAWMNIKCDGAEYLIPLYTS